MAFSQNIKKTEKIIRVVLGVVLVPLGLSLTGLWQLLSIVAGISLVLTAAVGYRPSKGLVLKVFSRK